MGKTTRTKRSEIPGKISKVEQFKADMPVLEACQKAGISYITYLKHRGSSGGGKHTSLDLYKQLVKAIRAEVLEELQNKLKQG